MNFKIIREGNSFYETDEQCMQKKQRKSSNQYNSSKNTTTRKQNDIFNYKYPTK